MNYVKRKPKKKLARTGTYQHECNPGPNWHIYDGDRMQFMLKRRWASRIFVAPHLSSASANEAMGLIAQHFYMMDHGRGTSLGDGWVATAHQFRGVPWLVVYDPSLRCAYIARPRDFDRAMGMKIWTVYSKDS